MGCDDPRPRGQPSCARGVPQASPSLQNILIFIYNIRDYSNWPSFPQVGSELVIDMIESDEFLGFVPQECIKSNALERIKTSLAKSPVVIFMKGTPQKPFDGYQQEAIDLLDKERIRYAYFDVLKDSDVREILKEYSKCISYPQVFVQGQLIGGGLTFMREMAEKGKFTHLFPQTEIIVVANEKIEKLIQKGRFMVFERGSPIHPQCLDSKQMMTTLKQYPQFMKETEYFDLTKDPEVIKNLVHYSNFSDIPQLYVDKKLVGGVEIIEVLDQTDELQSLLGQKIQLQNPKFDQERVAPVAKQAFVKSKTR